MVYTPCGVVMCMSEGARGMSFLVLLMAFHYKNGLYAKATGFAKNMS